jgi:GTP cyclohydrolase I
MMKLTQLHIRLVAQEVAKQLMGLFPKQTGPLKAYAVPRGGVPAAYAVGQHYPLTLVDDADEAQVIIDDIIDSGDTRASWVARYPHTPFVALIDKSKTDYHGQYLIFPWEQNEEGSFSDNVTRLLQYVGEDPKRGGLQETPARVAKAWKHWCKGYTQDVASVLKVFEDGGEGYDQMVTVKDIPIYSHCEHHLAAIFGTATISYIPNGKIVGLSKLSRVADIFARRLQVQERLTCQIADALVEHLQPKGVGVVIKARHMCMESRGVCQQGHHTITTALRGAMLDEPATRAEFLNLAR